MVARGLQGWEHFECGGGLLVDELPLDWVCNVLWHLFVHGTYMYECMHAHALFNIAMASVWKLFSFHVTGASFDREEDGQTDR